MADNQVITNKNLPFKASSTDLGADGDYRIQIQHVLLKRMVSGSIADLIITSEVEAYELSDIDNAGATQYYGFLLPSGAWYIKKITTTAVRYIKGASDYATSWTGRTGLTYDYYSEVF